ncbi:aldolase [Candidatus Dependentiae bacterium]|nr:aldolase [Candidatus Dependentiae bacterium]
MVDHAKNIPLTVPSDKQNIYLKNYERATRGKKRLFLFAGDQKIEHLHKDFYCPGVPEECASPEHMFEIASKSPIGVFATQLGLIAQYGADYNQVSYVVKLNSKTDLVPTEQKDPISLALHSVADIVQFARQTKLSVVGVGYTVYLGSEDEFRMLTEAAQVVHQAHQHGLLAILWMYPRGAAVGDEKDSMVIAGSAGVAACLGADFVKVNPPERVDALKQVVAAAGRTKVICSGGKRQDESTFLRQLEEQVVVAHVAGCAVGRNIHQRELSQAVSFCEKIAKILF